MSVPSSTAHDQEWFRKICAKNGIDFSVLQIGLLGSYVASLIEWNKKLNLISRRDEGNIWANHLLASISFHFRFALQTQSSLVDVGTGGGLPGIPIAILRPDTDVLLVDSIKKKINAVRQIISDLGIPNVRTAAGRAEDLGLTPEHGNKYDYIVSRGVAPMSDLVKWTKPFLKSPPDQAGVYDRGTDGREMIPRGTIILLKGGELEREIRQVQVKARPTRIDVHPITVDGVDFLFGKKLVVIVP